MQLRVLRQVQGRTDAPFPVSLDIAGTKTEINCDLQRARAQARPVIFVRVKFDGVWRIAIIPSPPTGGSIVKLVYYIIVSRLSLLLASSPRERQSGDSRSKPGELLFIECHMYYVFRGLIFAGQRASGILLFCDATEGVQASELCDRSLSTIPPPPAFWPARARSWFGGH